MAGERVEGAFTALSVNLRRQAGDLLRSVVKFGRAKPLGAMGGIVLVALVVMAASASLLAPHDPYRTNLKYQFASPGFKTPEEDGSKRFWLGTDQLGRDTLSRVIHGARISLRVGFISAGIGVTVGALIGLVTAYLGGAVDLTVQRLVDAFMAFPALIMALALMAILGPSLNNVTLALIIIFIPGSSRVVRSAALSVKETVYIEAARAIGSSNVRIMFRQVLPNCVAPYIVFLTANLGVAIVAEASLTFLGVGTPLDVPSWGGMVSVAGKTYVALSPWLLMFTSIAIFIVVFGFNLLGDALRDVLDPRLRGR